MSDNADLRSEGTSFSRGMSINQKVLQPKRPASAYHIPLGSGFQKLQLNPKDGVVQEETAMSQDD
jgi:hypothetical protein